MSATDTIPTPRTDAVRVMWGFKDTVDGDFARTLERELTQQRARAERAEGEFEKAVQISVEQAELALKYKRELETLRAENARLIQDRARFPDRPDDVGRMIDAHIENIRNLARTHEENWRRLDIANGALKNENAELRAKLTKE